MMRRVLVSVSVCFGALTLVVDTARSGFDSDRPPRALPVTWADASHGWRFCESRRALCSTNNGGASSRVVFRSKAKLRFAVRTSASAGVVGDLAGRKWWTRDNGLHWYRTELLGTSVQGSGPYLFWMKGRRVYQVDPWPPPGQTLRVHIVYTAPEPLLLNRRIGLRNIPGGIAAVVDSRDGYEPSSLLVYRLERVDLFTPPHTYRNSVCRGLDALIDWPEFIIVQRCRGVGLQLHRWNGIQWSSWGGGDIG